MDPDADSVSLLNIFISWFPLFTMYAFGIFVLRRYKPRASSFNDDHLAELRRISTAVERIAVALEGKSAAPPSGPRN